MDLSSTLICSYGGVWARGIAQPIGREMDETGIIRTVAANVRQARKAIGLSQEELALEAEVDRTYVSQVERGKRNITLVVLARLARALRTTPAALLMAGDSSKRRKK